MEETEGKEDFKQEVGLFICGVVDFESSKVDQNESHGHVLH